MKKIKIKNKMEYNFLYKQYGFTLIELILTIVLTVILAGHTLPKLFNYNTFKQILFTKGTYSTLYYAQSLAIGSGCHVAVNAKTSSISLRLRNNCTTGSFVTVVQDPSNISKTYLKQVPKGISLYYTNFQIYFDQNGQARSIYNNNTVTATITISDRNTNNTITIEGSKGAIN